MALQLKFLVRITIIKIILLGRIKEYIRLLKIRLVPVKIFAIGMIYGILITIAMSADVVKSF